jgi:hypothetical protein
MPPDDGTTNGFAVGAQVGSLVRRLTLDRPDSVACSGTAAVVGLVTLRRACACVMVGLLTLASGGAARTAPARVPIAGAGAAARGRLGSDSDRAHFGTRSLGVAVVCGDAVGPTLPSRSVAAGAGTAGGWVTTAVAGSLTAGAETGSAIASAGAGAGAGAAAAAAGGESAPATGVGSTAGAGAGWTSTAAGGAGAGAGARTGSSPTGST